jgi:hypothetical protein
VVQEVAAALVALAKMIVVPAGAAETVATGAAAVMVAEAMADHRLAFCKVVTLTQR